jgi:choline transport protein
VRCHWFYHHPDDADLGHSVYCRSEEVRNASDAIPKAMLAIFACNCALIIPIFVTVCYHVPDLDAALNDSTTYPAIYVLRQAMPPAGVTVMLVIITLLNLASNIVYLTVSLASSIDGRKQRARALIVVLQAVSRDLFAFSRDNGLPFSGWLGKIHPTRKIPQNAATFSCALAICLAMIYIGSKWRTHPSRKLDELTICRPCCVSR